MPSRTSLDGPKSLQDRPKTAQDRPKMPPGSPRSSQDALPDPPRRPKMPSRTPLDGPKGFAEAPGPRLFVRRGVLLSFWLPPSRAKRKD